MTTPGPAGRSGAVGDRAGVVCAGASETPRTAGADGAVHLIDPHAVTTICGLRQKFRAVDAGQLDRVTCGGCRRVRERRLYHAERRRKQDELDAMTAAGWHENRIRAGEWRPALPHSEK